VIAQLKDKGSVSRGWIGVQIASRLTSRQSRPQEGRKAALVAERRANGPAAKAGIGIRRRDHRGEWRAGQGMRATARTIGGPRARNAVKLNVLQRARTSWST